MPQLLIPRLRIVMQDLLCLKPINPSGDLLYVIIGGVNGDGSKVARVEPQKKTAGQTSRGWEIKSGDDAISQIDSEILYEERLFPMETAVIRLVFCVGQGGASREAGELAESLAYQIATLPPMFAFVMQMAWNPPERIIREDYVIGSVTIQAENLGQKISCLLINGANTAPVEKTHIVNSTSLELSGNEAKYEVTINTTLMSAV